MLQELGEYLLRSRVLLYLRYPLPIYPSCDHRVRIRYSLLLYVIRELRASLRRVGPVENRIGGAAVEIVRRSGVTLFRYGEQFPVL